MVSHVCCTDKSSPYLNVCPDDISSPVTSEGYALVSWTPPTFNGATSVISNFVPGKQDELRILYCRFKIINCIVDWIVNWIHNQLYAWCVDTTFPLGIDPIMYVAKNAALNYNECTFRALASRKY